MTEPEHKLFRKLTEGAWRLLGLSALTFIVTVLLWELRIVVLPLFVAMLLSSVLAPLVVRLERRGWPTLGATWLVFLAFLLVIIGAGVAILPPTIAELDGLSESVETGLNDVEDWLVTGPLNLDRGDVNQFTDDPTGRIADVVQSSSDSIISGAMFVGELLAGMLLALVLTFLLLKDGRRFQAWATAHLPHRHRDLVTESASGAWGALSGYLRGAAILGLVEAVIIGATLLIVGAPLAGPVAIFTFFGAFFPIVGAVLAGALAVLVTLATSGFSSALIVLVVVVAVQQLDNDLLVPFIYGQTLQLHPVVILVVLTAGGALGGIVGAFLAVPLAGAASGVFTVVWDRYGEEWVGENDETTT
ncbi:MAG: AI-2E family transporter [Acidimicrobiales bacterium]